MYSVRPTTRFSRDLKRLQKRGYNLDLLDDVIQMLAEGKPLPARMRDHPLVGDYNGGAGSLPVYDRRRCRLPRVPH